MHVDRKDVREKWNGTIKPYSENVLTAGAE